MTKTDYLLWFIVLGIPLLIFLSPLFMGCSPPATVSSTIAHYQQWQQTNRYTPPAQLSRSFEEEFTPEEKAILKASSGR